MLGISIELAYGQEYPEAWNYCYIQEGANTLSNWKDYKLVDPDQEKLKWYSDLPSM